MVSSKVVNLIGYRNQQAFQDRIIGGTHIVSAAALARMTERFEPKALLNTMAFAYATGVFTAEEIERRCSTDLDFRGVRPKLPPIASELKKFRKENLGMMKWCLVNVISRALKMQFIEGPTMDVLPPGLKRYVVENAFERLELARHMDRSGELL